MLCKLTCVCACACVRVCVGCPPPPPSPPQAHLLHDGTTKKGVHILQVTARAEFPGGHIQTMPMKFVVIRDSSSTTEAEATMTTMDSNLAHKPAVRMCDIVVSCHSDNDTPAVKVTEKLTVENQIQAMVPGTKAQHAKWMAMTPKQQSIVGQFYGRRCTGTSL